MGKLVRVLGIDGSLRRESYNRAALREATKLVPEDATLDIVEFDGIPGFNQDEEENPPPKVFELNSRLRESDAILSVTPKYNYSVPGVLKTLSTGHRDLMKIARGTGKQLPPGESRSGRPVQRVHSTICASHWYS